MKEKIKSDGLNERRKNLNTHTANRRKVDRTNISKATAIREIKEKKTLKIGRAN